MRKEYVKPSAELYYVKSDNKIADDTKTLDMPDTSRWTEYY